jgi:hypothetical protein
LDVLPALLLNQILLILGITILASISVASRLNKGIRLLSTLNLLVALPLTLFVFCMNISPKSVRIDQDQLWVELNDGRIIGVPLVWFSRLLNASAEKLDDY